MSLRIGSLYRGLVKEEAESVAKLLESIQSSEIIRSGKGELSSFQVILDGGDGVFKFCKEVLNKSPFEGEEPRRSSTSFSQ